MTTICCCERSAVVYALPFFLLSSFLTLNPISGLYINDLSMHDFSRDLMLAGTQQSVELKLALDQEQQKSKKLEESMRKLDEEMRRTDELLYQMIPKQVADRLRRGENPIDTCEVHNIITGKWQFSQPNILRPFRMHS